MKMGSKIPHEQYLESQVTHAQDRLAEYRSKRLLRCPHCKAASQVKGWTLCEVQFYVRPHGCTGGDHWQFSEPPDFELTCPKCKKTSEFHEHIDDKDAYALVCQYRGAFKQGEPVQRD
jgi:phage FluMu protein Com